MYPSCLTCTAEYWSHPPSIMYITMIKNAKHWLFSLVFCCRSYLRCNNVLWESLTQSLHHNKQYLFFCTFLHTLSHMVAWCKLHLVDAGVAKCIVVCKSDKGEACAAIRSFRAHKQIFDECAGPTHTISRVQLEDDHVSTLIGNWHCHSRKIVYQ